MMTMQKIFTSLLLGQLIMVLVHLRLRRAHLLKYVAEDADEVVETEEASEVVVVVVEEVVATILVDVAVEEASHNLM